MICLHIFPNLKSLQQFDFENKMKENLTIEPQRSRFFFLFSNFSFSHFFVLSTIIQVWSCSLRNLGEYRHCILIKVDKYHCAWLVDIPC